MAENGALELITHELVERGLGPLYDRLGPLSTGAVATGALIVGGSTILRRLLRLERSRALRWAGAVAAVPLAAWVVAETLDAVVSGGDEDDGARTDDAAGAGEGA